MQIQETYPLATTTIHQIQEFQALLPQSVDLT